MSSCSANATGLPDRRHFLSTIAAVGALGLPAMIPVPATASNPDAALLELDARLGQALAVASDLGAQCDEAYERFKPPHIPDALCWRRTDFPSVWVDRALLDSVGRPGVDERFIYASDGVLDHMRKRAAEWRATPPINRGFSDRCLARVEEIIAALDAYYPEEARRLAECGYTAAQEASDAQHKVVEELRTRIAIAPALTAEGVCVKVRAMLGYRNAGLMERGCFASLLAEPARDPQNTEELLSLSAMIDAAKLGAAPASDRRAA